MRGLLIIGLVQALALACVYAADPPPIPIVHTWGDLQNAPKISAMPNPFDKTAPPTGKPVVFQVGINSDTTTNGGAVLLYFLSKTDSMQTATPEAAGVYWLQVDGVAMETSETYPATQERLLGTYFFTEAIPFTKPGYHLIELFQPSNDPSAPARSRQLIARATIHVQGDPEGICLWYPLWPIEKVNGGIAHQENELGSGNVALVTMRNPKGDAAIPNPVKPLRYSGFPARNQALPQIISSDPAGSQVQIKMSDATLIATFPQQIEGFFPGDFFLTHWSVNGRPARLDPNAQIPGGMRILGLQPPEPLFQPTAWHGWSRLPELSVGALVWYTNEVHFNLDFKPEWLGAKAGDRIGVQCLFCPFGYRKTRTPFYQFAPFSFWRPGPDFALTGFSELSNRVEFTYSGDPKHPAR